MSKAWLFDIPLIPGFFIHLYALEWGFHWLGGSFLREFLGHYRLAPSYYAPSTWPTLATFATIYHAVGRRPSLRIWQSLFRLHMNRSVSGYFYFHRRASTYSLCENDDSFKTMKSKFFILASGHVRFPTRWVFVHHDRVDDAPVLPLPKGKRGRG